MSNDNTTPNSTPLMYTNLRIGINAQEWIRTYRTVAKTMETESTPEEYVAFAAAGYEHWGLLAAENEGVLSLRTITHTESDGRTHAVKPYPITSMPKVLRGALTSPKQGEVLIDVDWKASHWQILAWQSGDTQLIEDLRSGDMYATCFPQFSRSEVKVGLATILNGGGVRGLVGGACATETRAVEFHEHFKQILKDRWPKAKAHLKLLARQAEAKGLVTAENRHAAYGRMLMQIEAANLQKLCGMPGLESLGVSVVLPMHDGVLLSCPAASASTVAEAIAHIAAEISTGSQQEAEHPDTWVKVRVSSSWGAATPQLLGSALQMWAHRNANSTDDDQLAIVAAVKKSLIEQQKSRHHQATAEARRYKRALDAVKDAQTWLKSRLHEDPHADIPRAQLSVEIPCYTSFCEILRADRVFPKLRYNELKKSAEIGGKLVEDHIVRKTYYEMLSHRYSMHNFLPQMLFDAMIDVSMEDSYNPTKEWLLSLPPSEGNEVRTWVRDWLKPLTYSDRPEEPALHNTYGLKFMLGVIARAFKPGCKLDTMLVLQGSQGLHKSTLFESLAPNQCFKNMSVDPSDKDVVLRAASYTVVEWAELSNAGKRDQDVLKDYFSTTEDQVRPPYYRGDVRIKRQVVFVGTANESDILKDRTGSRRYWPMRMQGRVDLAAMRPIIPMLWAQALRIFNELGGHDAAARGEPVWWLSTEEDAERELQADQFRAEDPLVSQILNLAAGVAKEGDSKALYPPMTEGSLDAFAERLGWDKKLQMQSGHKLIAALRDAGFTNSGPRLGNTRIWRLK